MPDVAVGGRTFDARPDRVDLRDRSYSPRLVSLRRQYPEPGVIREYLEAYEKDGMILDEGQEGWCTGFGLEHVLKPMSLLIRDESTGELEHREVVGRDALPAHEQPPEAVVPAVGSLDDPAPWCPPHAAQEGWLASSSDVRDDPPTPNDGFRVGKVVALVQAQMLRASRAPRGAEHDRVEHVGHHPLVVHVGSGDQHGQGHAAPIREDVAFHPEFRAIRRVRTRGAPPLGALAMALSSDAKSHLMPRRLS